MGYLLTHEPADRSSNSLLGEIGLASELRAISDSKQHITVQSLNPQQPVFSHAAPGADADEHAPCHHGDVDEYVSDCSTPGVTGHSRQIQQSRP